MSGIPQIGIALHSTFHANIPSMKKNPEEMEEEGEA